MKIINPDWWAKFLVLAFGFLLSVIVAYSFSCMAQSLFVLSALEEIGADFSLTVRWKTIMHDLYGLTFSGKNISYGLVLLVGFLVALPTARLLSKGSGLSIYLLYPLAGAVTLATILYSINTAFFDLTFFAGTRGTLAYLVQLLSGSIGGGFFAFLSKRYGPWL